MALLFGATDLVSIPSKAEYNITNGTVSFWLRTTQATANASVSSRHDASSANGWYFALNPSAGKIRFSGPSGIFVADSTATVNDGVWHHIVGVWNTAQNGQNALWVGGVQQTAPNSSGRWSFNSQPILIGLDNNGFPGFVGSIGEYAWWNTQLTGPEIVALSQGITPSAVRPDPIVLYMPLQG